MFKETQRWLKSSLKRRVAINEATIIAFMIAGFFGLSNMTYGEGENERIQLLENKVIDKEKILIINKDNGSINREGFVNNFENIVLSKDSALSDESSYNQPTKKTIVIGAGNVLTYKEEYNDFVRQNIKTGIEEGVVIGNDAKGISNGATAVGYNSNAEGEKSLALGHSSYAKSVQSTAIGYNAKADDDQATVLGANTFAKKQSVAIGSDVYASGGSSIAIGNDDIADGADGYNDKLPDETIDKIFKDGENSNKAMGGSIEWSSFESKYKGEKRKYSPTYAKGRGTIAIGSRAIAYGNGATSMGTLSFALGNKSTALGLRAFTDFSATGSTAIGEESRTFAANTLAIGNKSEATSTGSLAFGTKSKAVGFGSISIGENVAANAELSDDSNIIFQNRLKEYAGLVKLDSSGKIVGDNNVENLELLKTGNSNALVQSGFANRQKNEEVKNQLDKLIKGTNNDPLSLTYKTDGDEVINTGESIYKTKKKGEHAISMGYYIYNVGNNTVAIGTGSRVLGSNSIAMGALNYVDEKAANSMALGVGANVHKENSIAMGTGTTVIGAGSVAIGSGVATYKNNSIGIGYGVRNLSPYSLALGSDANIGLNSQSSIALGTNATVDKNVEKGIAIGNGARVKLANSTALGVDSITDYTLEDLNKPGYIPKGTYTIPTSGKIGVISVGSNGNERRITNVASGYKDTDAVNVAQLRALEDRIEFGIPGGEEKETISFMSIDKTLGEAAKIDAIVKKEKLYKEYINLKKLEGILAVREKSGDEINDENKQKILERIQEIERLDSDRKIIESANNLVEKIKGINRKSEIDYNTADKRQNEYDEIEQAVKIAEANKSNIVSSDDQALIDESNYNNKGAKAKDSIAIGYKSSVEENAEFSIAIGNKAKVTKEHSVAIGNDSESADYSVALGRLAKSLKIGSTAIGENSKANADRATALGNNSIAEHQNAVAVGYQSKTTNVSGGGYDILTELNSTVASNLWVPTHGAFAVGDSDKVTRRITGVAAGQNDTDAVNVAQLKNIKLKYGSGDETSKTTGIKNGLKFKSLTDKLSITAKDDGIIEFSVSGGSNIDDKKLIVVGSEEIEKNKFERLNKNDGTLTIKGGKATTGYKGDNIKTKVDNGSLLIGFNESPKFKELILSNDGTTETKITAENLNTIMQQLGLSEDASKPSDGSGSGLTVGSQGSPQAGTVQDSVQSNDGLEGKSLNEKIDALRKGTAGSVVYTDSEGNRLVKAKNGKFYKKEDLQDNGMPKANVNPVENIMVSLVDPVTGKITPQQMGNVASGIGEVNNDNKKIKVGSEDKAISNDDAIKVMEHLLTINKKSNLNKVATVGDLQAVAQAGLTFNTNINGTIHKTLGTTLSILGNTNISDKDKGKYENKNILTYVDDSQAISISMAKEPVFDKVTLSEKQEGKNVESKDLITKGYLDEALNAFKIKVKTGKEVIELGRGDTLEFTSGKNINVTVEKSETNSNKPTSIGNQGNGPESTTSATTTLSDQGNTVTTTAGTTSTENISGKKAKITHSLINNLTNINSIKSGEDETGAKISFTTENTEQNDAKNKIEFTIGIKENENGSQTVKDKKIIFSKSGLDLVNKKITNLENGEISKNSKDAVNGSQLFEIKQQLGLVKDENSQAQSDEKDNALSNDGLDNKTIAEKIDALRNGSAGLVVNTDKKGNRLIKKGGKFYEKDAFDKDGKLKPDANEITDIKVSLVDPITGEIKKAQQMGNIASGIGLDEIEVNNNDNMTDVENKKINDFIDKNIDSNITKNAVNVKDLHSVSKAIIDKGLLFGADKGNVVKKSLGKTINIKGDGTTIHTEVDKDGDIIVSFNKEAKIEKIQSEGTKLDNSGVEVAPFVEKEELISDEDAKKLSQEEVIEKDGKKYKKLKIKDETVANSKYGNDGVSIKKASGEIATYRLDGTTIKNDKGSSELLSTILKFKDKKGNSKVQIDGEKTAINFANNSGRITGLADPINEYDAVNKRYVDTVKSNIDGQVDGLKGGVAGAMAMANLVQANSNSEFRHQLSAAFGAYDGKQALAVGYSGVSQNRRLVYKLSGSVDSAGKLGFGAGIGIMLGEKQELKQVSPNSIKEVDMLKKHITKLEEKNKADIKRLEEKNKEDVKRLEKELQEMKELLKKMSK